MTQSLVEKYQRGMITRDHFVVECLSMIDPQDPGLHLSTVPENLLRPMLQFAKECLHGRLLTNYGVLPTPDQVRSACGWIEKSLLQRANTVA